MTFYLTTALLFFPCFLFAQKIDFNAPADTSQFSWLHNTEKWPNKVYNATISDGIFSFEAGTSGWFSDMNAPFLYKEISGDFDVRTRIQVGGRTTDLPETAWSLGGLMVRVPKPSTSENWQPGRENWIFMTTGVAAEPGKRVLETKYTLRSSSHLKLRPVNDGWITLRIVRSGFSMLMLYKMDGDKTWTLHDRFYIVGWPPVLQVGMNAYTNSEAVPQDIRWRDHLAFNKYDGNYIGSDPDGKALMRDIRMEIDWIDFRPAKFVAKRTDTTDPWLTGVTTNPLADINTPMKEMLRLIGE